MAPCRKGQARPHPPTPSGTCNQSKGSESGQWTATPDSDPAGRCRVFPVFSSLRRQGAPDSASATPLLSLLPDSLSIGSGLAALQGQWGQMLPSATSLTPHPGTEIVPSCPRVEPEESFSWAASGYLAGHAGNLATSSESRPAQLPGVSEFTTAVDLQCRDGRTGDSELSLHVVRSPRLVFHSMIFVFYLLWIRICFTLIK